MEMKLPATVQMSSRPLPEKPGEKNGLAWRSDLGLSLFLLFLVNQVGIGSAFSNPNGMRKIVTLSGVPTP